MQLVAEYAEPGETWEALRAEDRNYTVCILEYFSSEPKECQLVVVHLQIRTKAIISATLSKRCKGNCMFLSTANRAIRLTTKTLINM